MLQVGFSFRVTGVCGIVIVLFSLVFSFPEVQAREFHVATASGLQNALATAQSNGQDDTIYLAAGIYNAVENGRSFTYDSTDGDNCTLTICGENGTTPEEVILDGGNAFCPVLSLVDQNPDHLKSSFTVRGITIKNGKMQEWDQNGGGLYIDLESEGSQNSWVRVENCIIRDNIGDDAGGVAIYVGGQSVKFANNIVIGNTAMDDNGGAEICSDDTIICFNNIIASNVAKESVGGIEICGECGGRELLFINNTIIANSAMNNEFCEGGGIDIDIDTTAYLYNNIIWGNKSGGESSDIVYFENVEAYDYYNDYHSLIGSQNFLVSVGHIDADPLFLNPAGRDYHLSANSPCIDAGTSNVSAPGLPETDFEGDPRRIGAAPDLGADEYARFPIPTPDIKVNNSDGPVTLNHSDTLTITVSLNNSGRTDEADWWLAADTPFGLWFFTFDGWTNAWVPGYQGALFYLDSFEVLTTPVSGLPPGTYTIYFGVDTNMDGHVTWDRLCYDSAVVNVTGYSYLLDDYAPVLKFSLGEGYFPTRAENMLNHSCSRVNKKGETVLDLLCDGDATDWDNPDLLSLSNEIREDYAIYGRVISNGHRIYLQYWFFYLYNDWARDKQGVNNHEGDWEMIVVELDEQEKPLRVGYSQHNKLLPGVPFLRGGEVRAWEDLVSSGNIEGGTHPVVYVARGSHACYPESASRSFKFGGVDIGEVHRGDGWILRPPNYDLIKFAWFDPNIKWGMHDGSPMSPTAQGDKWYHPDVWMNGLQ